MQDQTFVIFTAILTAQLIFVCYYDVTRLRIPNVLNSSLFFSGLGAAIVAGHPSVSDAVLASVVAFCTLWIVREAYHWWRGYHGLGLGDVKFMAAGGVWTGLKGIPYMLFYSCLFALTAIIIISVLRGRHISSLDRWPFGPFLAAGLLFVWTLGPDGLFQYLGISFGVP